jgi:hypothetical protein
VALSPRANYTDWSTYKDEYLELKEIRAGVPQGSVLGTVLYLLYVSDLPDAELYDCYIWGRHRNYGDRKHTR